MYNPYLTAIFSYTWILRRMVNQRGRYVAWSGGGCIIVTSTIRCDVVWHIGEAIVIVASRVCRADYQRCIPCNSRIQIGASSEPPADSSADAFKRQQTNLPVVPMMSCRLSDAGLLSEPCWSIVNWGHEKASQWKSDEDIHIFYKENEFVYKHYMLSWPQHTHWRQWRHSTVNHWHGV